MSGDGNYPRLRADPSEPLLAYAAIRVQCAATKEAVLHHALGQEKDKSCQNNDEEELEESGQTHSLLIGVHRIPGRSHTNRLSGLRLQAAVSVRAAIFYCAGRIDERVVEHDHRS